MPSDKSREERYNNLFEGFCSQIRERLNSDLSFSIKDVKKLLETQYVFEGHDWAGRGEPMNTVIAAAVAAYEHIIAEWEKRSQSTK